MTQAASKVIQLPKPSTWSRRWTKTRYSNLQRYFNGTYYAYAKVGGVKIQRSLKTKSITIAKIRLDTLLDEERAKAGKVSDLTEAGTTGELITVWIADVIADPELKPSSKLYKQDCVKAIRSHWPGLDGLRITRITEGLLSTWATRFRKHYSPTRFNGALEVLKSIFEQAVKQGLLASNPVQTIQRASVRLKARPMPSTAQFRAILKALEKQPKPAQFKGKAGTKGYPGLVRALIARRKAAALMIRFLAYSGLRISAARAMTPDNIDLKRNELIAPPVKYQSEPVRIPMSTELRKACAELLRAYPGSGRLLAIADPKKALKTACVEAGVEPALTPHDLRRLFITSCLECGVDIPTLALWVGHKDGGALLMRVYAKIRMNHSHKMAKLVRF